MDEIVGFGHDGSIERGAKVIEGGTLLVMEMKETDVAKFLTVLLRCLKGSTIQRKSVATCLSDPLEFLGDIEIDACSISPGHHCGGAHPIQCRQP